MILLDTNVLSEAMKPNGDPSVLAWIDAQAVETLYLSTITLAELRFGIAALPDSRCKESLRLGLERRVLPLFGGRILAFGIEAAEAYGALRARARAAGKAVGVADGYIAAVAAVQGLTVATRDVSSFLAAGLPVVDPWQP